jgi:hypothetical protein
MAEAIEVTVTGLKETLDSLKKVEGALDNLTDANRTIASTIASKASALAPRLTGALASSIKGTSDKDKARITAGGDRVVYAGVQEYGWPEKNIQAQPYLRPAVQNNMSYIVQQYEENIQSVIKKYNLN